MDRVQSVNENVDVDFMMNEHLHTDNSRFGDKQQQVRFNVFTAVTMMNVVFWDIKTQFILHRRHITSPLQSSGS
jgi:hypothetical protein